MKNHPIQLCYANKKSSITVKHLTPEVFDELLNSKEVDELITKIENEPDEDKKSEYKNELPVFLFQAQFPDNRKRPHKDDAKPSGFCMHDWDHMDTSPRVFYDNNIAGKEKELGIVLAHITPRGQGLRLVTVLKPGETIDDAQTAVAALFGMQTKRDLCVKDVTRTSFVVPKRYLLYYDREGLFEHEMPEEVEVTPVTSNTTTTVAPTLSLAETLTYQGIKFGTIIEALLQRIATQGKPQVGERNTDLYVLVRELRHICDYNFLTILELVTPYFEGLPEAEIRRTITSSLASTGRTITPVMKGVIAELKNQNVEDAETEEGLQTAKLPKVAPIEEMILEHYPKHLRAQVYLSMLPIWGVYGTHIRFDYMDGRENSLSFMTAVVGKSGSGKAFAAHLFEQMTQTLQAEDAIERQKADEYLAIFNKTGEGAEKPDDPRTKVRLFGDDITTSQMLEYLDNLKGEHAIQFSEEVARLQKAKRTIYGDNDDLYCKAFDNAVGGKESKSKLTRNIRLKVFLNTLFCGTPGAMHKFYNNPEGGLNNRILFTFMPSVRVKGFPNYQKFTTDERNQFEETVNKLRQAGTNGEKTLLPWLQKTITLLKNKWDKEDNENPNDVLYDLGKRALVVAMRAGVLEWYLRGCTDDEKQHKEIGKLVKWVAETMRQNVYAFSGQDYEEINEADNNYMQKQVRLSKNKMLFSILADEFTTQDLITLRVKNGDSTNVKMVLCRWVADGMIRKTAEGRYKKIPQLVA